VSEAIETQVLDGARAPQQMTSLFGHGEAEDFLAQAYRSGKSHHAILIEGPEGIGKATLAFRFANHVLTYPDTATAPAHLSAPDPQSPVFRQISGGASHNLLYLARPADPKTGKLRSAITVDEVRRAGKFFAQTSGTGNWRIVIVDSADELNRNAANAILKLLEEPPKRAMFLMLSHAPGKLLPTIRSRCLPLVLRALDRDALVAALDALAIALPPVIRDRVLDLSGGSVAQAIKLVNYGGLDIIEALDRLAAATGPSQRKAMHKLADAVAQKDGDTLYGFFVDHLCQRLAARARSLAMAGDVQRAFELSRLQSGLSERFTVAAAYNLERKQTVLGVLGDAAQHLA
jgi:DNA polymerase-3 subunit delta'